MDTVRRNDGHGSVRHVSLEGPTVIVVCTNDCCVGEYGGIEVFFSGSRRARSTRRRVRQVRQTELLWNCVGDIDIR